MFRECFGNISAKDVFILRDYTRLVLSFAVFRSINVSKTSLKKTLFSNR